MSKQTRGPGRPPGTPNPNAGRPALPDGEKQLKKQFSISAKVSSKIDALAERWGIDRSAVIARLVSKQR